MDLSAVRIHGFKSLLAVLALTACTGTSQATNLLTATPGSATLSCNTATGPSTGVAIVVKPVTPLTTTNTLVVTVTGLSGGLVVTPPAVTVLSVANQTAGITYTVGLAPGCAGVVSAGTPSVTLQAAASTTTTPLVVGSAAAGVVVTTTTALTATSSALVATPSPIVLTCAYNGSTYVPGASKTVSVTSAATGGTPFTVDGTAQAWATVTAAGGLSAGATPATFTIVAAAGCGGFASGTSNQGSISLVSAPAPMKSIPVTLQVVPYTPLTANPATPSISYVKGSGTPGHVDVVVASGSVPAPFFSLDTSTLPIWLTVDSTSGTTPKTLHFTSTNVTDTLAPGTYNASVVLKVSGYGDFTLPVSLLVNNKAPKLSVVEGTTRAISWTLGTPLPTPTITAISSDTPIAYTATSGGVLAPIISASQQKGLAYSFGTPINLSFSPLLFASAAPGSVLSGTVTLTWGSPASTIVVTLNVSVQAAGAAVTTLTPASIPTAVAGTTFSVVLSGTGFVPGSDPAQVTKVGIVVGQSIVVDPNISVTVVNPSNISLVFKVPTVADANLPFATGGTVALGVCNPGGSTCTIPTGTATLTIGTNPTIQAVTSASAFLQVNPPALQTMAPYDIISVFGSNFCSSNLTGCTSTQVLAGVVDPVTLRYPLSLSPDSGAHTLAVIFQTHSGGTLIATAPLLFATNTQINLLVPGALTASIGSTVDMVVTYGGNHSTTFPVSITASNPGIFTVGSDGQGDGAILNSAYAVISSTNPGGMRSTASDSDTVELYVTGLGAPTSTGNNDSAGTNGGAVAPTDCITPASYLVSLNSITNNSFTSIDGTVIQSALLNTNRLVPCFVVNPAVTIGGVSATVTYAGFVPDSITGLYQINAKLPGSAAGSFTTAAGATIATVSTPVQLPVMITAGGVNSQAGVSMWVAARLLVTPPSGAGLSGTVGLPWGNVNNGAVATEGTSPYRYALTSGLLPSGLVMGGTTGLITGTPTANTAGSYTVTVTATDSANIPLTGTATFTITVAGGLFVISSGTPPYHGTFGSASNNLTTVTGTGGAYPYSYAITSPSPVPAGMAVNVTTGVVSTTALTPAGTYHVTVTVTDSNGLTGSITFDVAVALLVTKNSSVPGTHAQASTITTVTATGNTGTVAYALDATTTGLGWVSISAGGVVTVTSSSVAGTYPVTVTATDGTAAPGAATAGTGTITFNLVIN